MIIKMKSCTIIGIEAQPIEIEVDVSKGYPSFNIVGLPDTAIKESIERIRSAIKNSNIKFPYEKRIIINLAPADIKKQGPAYDLPMALGIIISSLKLNFDLSDKLFIGELSLKGEIRPVSGILPKLIFAKQNNFKQVFIPYDNLHEANLIKDIDIIPVKTLTELLNIIQNPSIKINRQQTIKPKVIQNKFNVDFSEIKGHKKAKRALEIAAAGGHNVLMCGPPGSGKTLLAKAFISILPKMTNQEYLEVMKIYSIAGLLKQQTCTFQTRPFRNPHHSSSISSLVGGGRIPRPGEISLAHRGVLFLDELPEFPRNLLEALRQPLEDGIITISRTKATYTFPARFILIASYNPCPCGYYTDPKKECKCTINQIQNYIKKISGPIKDRFDIHLEIPRLEFSELTTKQNSESSETIRKRVEKARQMQTLRFKNKKQTCNSEMNNKQIEQFCQLEPESKKLLKTAVEKFCLSARSYMKILRIARTIADLDESVKIKTVHIAESLQYREIN